MRGRGVAPEMLKSLLGRNGYSSISYIETTVTPSNEKSRRFFYSISREFNCKIEETDCFSPEHFGISAHEKEILFKIGPLEKTAFE